MATIAAVLTLIPGIDEELAAICALHELVELSLNELVSVHFVDLALAHAHGTLPSETTRHSIERPFSDIFLD